jgi:eukaryotic-like serine/threonine-protein kinase
MGNNMRSCDKCGTTWGDYGPEGLCPKCMLLDGFGEENARRFDDYELLEEIAHGGMGVVWKARQVSLNRTVAVKLMLSGTFAKPEFVKRFRAEAEAAASLQHPHLVAIHEIGEYEGQPFFSMDFVEGQNLAQLVRDRPLPVQRAAGYLKTIAEAVQYAHQQGILHRDLKPSNILIDAFDQPRITDFGLAKRLSGDADLTLSGQVLGSPNYLPPEQAEARHDAVGPASDVYSLGAVLYCLITGRAPFQAATVADTLKQVTTTDPVSPRLLNPSVPKDLETICLKCLEKEIPSRYGTAQELADELGRFLRSEPIEARPAGAFEKGWRWCRRNPALADTLAGLAIVLLAGFIGVLTEWRHANRHAANAEKALQDSRESLWQANYERAHAWRAGGQMGQRVRALAAIRNAAALRPSAELRMEALAAFVLTDLEDTGDWLSIPANIGLLTLDGRGARTAFVTSDRRIEVWSIADRVRLAVISNTPSAPSFRFSHNGSRLAVEGEERSFVWDVAGQRVVLEIIGRCALGLSADGRRLVRASPDRGAAVVDLETGAQSGRLEQALRPEWVVWSPDARRVALLDGPDLEIWNLATQRKDAALRLPATVYDAAWRPDGAKLVVVCDDPVIRVWQWAENRVRELRGHEREGVRVYYHPGGRLLASSAFDVTLRLWDPDSGAPLLAFSGVHPRGFTADGQWLMVHGPKGLGRMRVHCPAECRLMEASTGNGQGVNWLEFSPSSRWLAASSSSQFALWDAATGQLLQEASLPDGSVCFLDDQTLLTGSAKGMQAWTNAGTTDVWKPAEPTTLHGPSGSWAWIDLSFDHQHLIGKQDGAGKLIDLPLRSIGQGSAAIAIPEPCLRLAGQPGFARAVLSADSQWIASGTWNNQGDFGPGLWVWSARDGQVLRKIPLGNCVPYFSPDGRWFLAAGAKEYILYAIEGPPDQWREIRRERRESLSVVAGEAAFATHCGWLAFQADEREIRLLDMASRRELARLTPLAPRIDRLAWSDDGRWLAAGSRLGIQVWDVRLIRERLRELGLDWE